MSGPVETWRIALLGDDNVGKSTLAKQLCAPNNHVVPPLDEELRKTMVVDGRQCVVEVIDTAGQEYHEMLGDTRLQQGHGYLLIYSVTSRTTFERIEIFRTLMVRFKGPAAIFALVGNKCDSAREREVSQDDGQLLANGLKCPFIETSAKTAANVDRMFSDIVRQLRKAPPEVLDPPTGRSRSKSLRDLVHKLFS